MNTTILMHKNLKLKIILSKYIVAIQCFKEMSTLKDQKLINTKVLDQKVCKKSTINIFSCDLIDQNKINILFKEPSTLC